MKRNWTGWASLMLVSTWAAGSAQVAAAAPANGQQVVPDIIFDAGSGQQPQPDTNLDADNYLKKMRTLIEDYNKTVGACVLGPNGAKMDPDLMNAAAERTQQLSAKIQAIKPPRAVASQHVQLANSLSAVKNFLQLGGSSAQGLSAAVSLISTVQGAMSNYHQAVLSMITQRGLNPGLDPFATENEADKQRALQGIDQLQQQFTDPASSAALGTGLGGTGLGGTGLGGTGLSGTGLSGAGLGGAGLGGAGLGGAGLGGTGLGGAGLGGTGLGGIGSGAGLGAGTAGGAAPNMGSLLQGLMGGTAGSASGPTPDMSNFLKGIDPQTLNSLTGGSAGSTIGAPGANGLGDLLKQMGSGSSGLGTGQGTGSGSGMGTDLENGN